MSIVASRETKFNQLADINCANKEQGQARTKQGHIGTKQIKKNGEKQRHLGRESDQNAQNRDKQGR